MKITRILCTLLYQCEIFHFQLKSIDFNILWTSRAKLCDGWYKTVPYSRYEITLKWFSLINYKCDQPVSSAIIVSQRMKYMSELHVLSRRWAEMYNTHANACNTYEINYDASGESWRCKNNANGVYNINTYMVLRTRYQDDMLYV